MSLADEILAIDDLPREEVAVPEWGNRVLFVRTMMADERDAFEREVFDEDGEVKKGGFRCKLILRTLIDSDGTRVFEDRHLAAVGRKSSAVISRLYDVAARLNAIREKDEEELIKNSKGGRPAALPTDSSDTSRVDATTADGT